MSSRTTKARTAATLAIAGSAIGLGSAAADANSGTNTQPLAETAVTRLVRLHLKERPDRPAKEVARFKTVRDVGKVVTGSQCVRPPRGEASKRFATITLELGYTATDDLWQWAKKTEAGTVEKRSGSVSVFAADGKLKTRYRFYEGWPCKWNVPDIDSDSSAMAIEKVEIAVEKVERS